jgi:hypothetical protein
MFAWCLTVGQESDVAAQERPRQEERKAGPEAAIPAPHGSSIAAPRQKLGRPDEQRKCGDPMQERQSELCAQWAAADAGNRSADWTVIATIINFIALLGVGGALYYNSRSVRIAGETADRQLRAYLNIESVKAEIDYRRDFFRYDLRVNLRNDGATRAVMTEWIQYVYVSRYFEKKSQSSGVNQDMAFRTVIGPHAPLVKPHNVGFSLLPQADERMWFVVKIVYSYEDFKGRTWKEGSEWRSHPFTPADTGKSVDLFCDLHTDEVTPDFLPDYYGSGD